MSKRIAIVGSGISGLTCAYLLHRQHEITLFEANDYIGGHTATVDVEVEGTAYALDTGFIVFNDWTYPNFIKLLDKLGVAAQPTQMSFSVKNLAEDLEYNGHTLNTLFAQRRNLLRPKFWRLVADIVRFNRLCKTIFARQSFDEQQSLGAFLIEHRFSDVFTYNYILPMCAAIWSASLSDIRRFPLKFFLQFFNNHGLLNLTQRPQWYTLIGGSRAYIKPLTAGFADRIALNSAVTEVNALDPGYELVLANGERHKFDEVILACHSDQALKMLRYPSAAQQRILSALPYADNEVVLHTDTSLLPQRPLAWASWNYELTGAADEEQAPAAVTYNMNILQCLQSDTTFCVTLNNSAAIDPAKVLRKFTYAHPQIDQHSVIAQQQRGEICGVDGLHFCGAYWYNGFHEDGVRSALDVCQRFGVSL